MTIKTLEELEKMEKDLEIESIEICNVANTTTTTTFTIALERFISHRNEYMIELEKYKNQNAKVSQVHQ